MSAVHPGHDEAIERALFERRARALGVEGGVPSLEAVLRAAAQDAQDPREPSRGRRRAWTGMVLAAGCLVAVTRTRPRDGSPAMTADGATANLGGEVTGGTCEDDGAWTIDTRYAAYDGTSGATGYSRAIAASPVPEGRACVAPPATFESASPLACERDDANRSEMP